MVWEYGVGMWCGYVVWTCLYAVQCSRSVSKSPPRFLMIVSFFFLSASSPSRTQAYMTATHDVRYFLFAHFSIIVLRFPRSLLRTRRWFKNIKTAVVAIVPSGTFV